MTRPFPRPSLECRHCHERIYPTGREWVHWHRDEPACIVESRYTGTHAEPADTPCGTEEAHDA